MKINELITLAKNLVIKYNEKNKIFDVDQNCFRYLNLTQEKIRIEKTIENSDGSMEVHLLVPEDPWWLYKISYNPQDERKIITSIEMR